MWTVETLDVYFVSNCPHFQDRIRLETFYYLLSFRNIFNTQATKTDLAILMLSKSGQQTIAGGTGTTKEPNR